MYRRPLTTDWAVWVTDESKNMMRLSGMSSGSKMRFLPSLLGLPALALMCTSAFAQQAPDAGSILREQPRLPAAAPKASPVKPSAVQEPARSGPRLMVKGFRIQGASLIPAAELNDQLKDFVGQERSFPELQRAATELIAYYAQKGYLARVVLPPQDVVDGVVTLVVTEGRRGALRVEKTAAPRVDAGRVQAFIDRRLGSGAVMNVAALEEALNILNDQPGVAVRSSIAPGATEGAVDLEVTAEGKPLTAFSISADNRGARASGESQLTGIASLINPTGNFDAASLLVNESQGTSFGRADYSLAAGNSGLRLGVNASALRYRLVQSTFSALQANGTAATVGLNASYPLIRRNDLSLALTASLDEKQLTDRTVAGETGNRRVSVGTMGLNGAVVDGAFGGGATQFEVIVHAGDSDQRNAGALAADLATRRVQGSYTKLAYSVRRSQIVGRDWNLSAGLRGQLADRNLDSTERFVLGGPSGVRAYPVGEAAADEGWLLTLSLARRIAERVNASVFVDTGGVTLNHSLWNNWNAANPRLPNRYQLSGAGVGVDWRFATQGVLNFSIAAPIGSNPGRDVADLNVDGRKKGARAWLSVNLLF